MSTPQGMTPAEAVAVPLIHSSVCVAIRERLVWEGRVASGGVVPGGMLAASYRDVFTAPPPDAPDPGQD